MCVSSFFFFGQNWHLSPQNRHWSGKIFPNRQKTKEKKKALKCWNRHLTEGLGELCLKISLTHKLKEALWKSSSWIAPKLPSGGALLQENTVLSEISAYRPFGRSILVSRMLKNRFGIRSFWPKWSFWPLWTIVVQYTFRQHRGKNYSRTKYNNGYRYRLENPFRIYFSFCICTPLHVMVWLLP